MKGCLIFILICLLASIAISASSILLPIGLILFVIFIFWKIYEIIYYKSSKFSELKNRIDSYIQNCNELNDHIEELKETYLEIKQVDYGNSNYFDNSKYNYKRPELKNQKYASNVYDCFRTVCDNARKQSFKYLCKYFDIKSDEVTLAKFEEVLNNFESAEQGQILLKKEREEILSSISNEIPFLIRHFSKKNLEKHLGFKEIDFKTVYFPKYIFNYVSSGGNASMQCEVLIDIDNLNKFVNYLSENIKFKKSVKGQRALMTSSLRKQILEHDGYVCKYCGASLQKEPNLLLEVDHIIPVSKGGMTTVDNLQTLCWRCNRKKGAKIG